MRTNRHRSGGARRRAGTTALTASAALLAALLPGQTATASAPAGVVTMTVAFRDGQAAPGSEVRLVAQPDPVWPATGDGAVQYLPEVEMATAVADSSGAVALDVPETASLVEVAAHQGGYLKAVLSYTARRGTDTLPVYYKAVTPLTLTLDAESGTFAAPPAISLNVLQTLPEFDATLVEQLGERTIADVGTLASTLDPEVARMKAELEQEMARRGYVFDNEAVAYNVQMLDGTYTYVTLAPENLLVRESPDADVYDIVGITTGGFPTVDTTDVGDAVDDVTLNSIPGQKHRGEWSTHHGDCYSITGPANADARHKYKRTVCYRVDTQELDNVKGTTFWQYEEDASGTAVAGKMQRIWVHGQPYGHGTAVPHTDQQPQPSETEYGSSSCQTRSTTISATSGSPVTVGLSTAWSKTVCKDAWHGPVPKGDGEHAAEWRTYYPIDAGNVRHIAMVLPVKAATKDGSPIWNILSGQYVT